MSPIVLRQLMLTSCNCGIGENVSDSRLDLRRLPANQRFELVTEFDFGQNRRNIEDIEDPICILS